MKKVNQVKKPLNLEEFRTFIPIKVGTRDEFKLYCTKNKLTYDEAILKLVRGETGKVLE